MPLKAATHSGPFHADDVLSWALIRLFYAADAELVRTRDPARIKAAELVFDVGGKYDPDSGRFDHHQASYTGPCSSAGMILAWLVEQGHVLPDVGAALKAELVDYVDAIDTGRQAPDPAVPCFARMVEAYTQGNGCLEEFDAAFYRAVAMAEGVVLGIKARLDQIRAAEQAVLAAMRTAETNRTNVMELDGYYSWKPVYFANGGCTHPTEFVLFPGLEGTWRIVAIPPEQSSFAQKRSLPESWAGLTGSSLSAVTGVSGSLFCHKNRFIAVFETRDAAVQALEGAGLVHG